MYYLISYAAMSIGAFAIVAARERELARPVTLDGMAGIGWERPGMGAAMTLFMFGFIGLPPAGLFIGKFYAFSAAVDRGLGLARRRRRDRNGRLDLLLPRRRPRDVLPARRSRRSRLPAARRRASWRSEPPSLLAVVVTIGSFVAAQPLLDIATDAVSVLSFPH